nr:DUF2312 domain-containing protein [Methylopila sp. 73B]
MTDPSPDAVAKEQLSSFVGRIERVNEQRDATANDLKEIYAEARSNGFDVKVLKRVISIRRMNPDDRAEMDALLDLYLSALGMQS